LSAVQGAHDAEHHDGHRDESADRTQALICWAK
jgi:hypothetical protein